MKLLKYIFLIALMVSVAALPSLAQDKKDLKSMVCAAIETYDCGYGEDCKRGSAFDINLPILLDIDFERKRITGVMDDSGQADARDHHGFRRRRAALRNRL